MTDLTSTRSGHVVIGVDTHKHIHVAAVMDTIGGILATLTIPTDTGGFRQLLAWAEGFGRILAFGIEGTGSYGATLTSFLRRHDVKVVEAGRPDRRLRRANGKSDTLDAENAARAVLAGFATAIPKTADGAVEMIRQLKVAHDSAVVNRSSTMIMMKAMLVHGSDEMRYETNRMSRPKLARHLAGLRPRTLEAPDDALRYSVRSLARRWLALDAEAKELESLIEDLVRRTAPQLLEQFGIGVDTAAEILIVAGDNPERIRSEAAFAKLAGIAPVPTGSGMTSGKHRINHGGHRQLNAAIYRTVIVRMRFHEPTIAYVARRTPKDEANATSSAVSSATSSARSTTSSRPTRQPAKSGVDNYRSFNALAESTIGLFKNEAIRDGSPFRTGPLRTIDDVEWVTAGWVDWYNARRLHSTLGDVPPDEYEAAYYADLETPAHPVLEPA